MKLCLQAFLLLVQYGSQLMMNHVCKNLTWAAQFGVIIVSRKGALDSRFRKRASFYAWDTACQIIWLPRKYIGLPPEITRNVESSLELELMMLPIPSVGP